MISTTEIRLQIENIAKRLKNSDKYLPLYEENKDCLPYITIENEFFILQMICENFEYHVDKEKFHEFKYEKRILCKTKDLDEFLYCVFKCIVRAIVNSSRYPIGNYSEELNNERHLFLFASLSAEWENRLRIEFNPDNADL